MTYAAGTKRGRGRTRDKVRTIRAVERGLEVLECLSCDGPSALSNVARRSNLSASTAFRILETLRQRGYVIQHVTSGHYSIGVKALGLGARYLSSSQLNQLSDQVLRKLVTQSGETANLAIRDGEFAVYVHQVESERPIRAFTQIGARVPGHCSGVGKVLLAYMDDKCLQALLKGQQFERFTRSTITNRANLLAELKRVRTRGFAIDNEERSEGVRCVSAAVRDRSGNVVAALSISGPASRLLIRRLGPLAKLVVAAAEELSTILGFQS